jgi:hypothetical protein
MEAGKLFMIRPDVQGRLEPELIGSKKVVDKNVLILYIALYRVI